MLRRAEIGVPGSFIVSRLCNSLETNGKTTCFLRPAKKREKRQWVLSVAKKGPRDGVKAFCLQLRYNANQHITSD